MKLLALLVITCVSMLGGEAAFTPQFEQGYVANLNGWHSQAMNPYSLPTPATVESLALKFGAKIEVAELHLANFKPFVPVDQKARVDAVLPYAGDVKPAVKRYLVFKSGKKLPSGYVTRGDVVIDAWFFAFAFVRNAAELAEADCYSMIEAHEKQTLGVEY